MVAFYEETQSFGVFLAIVGVALLFLKISEALGLAVLGVGLLMFFGSGAYTKTPEGPSADEGSDDSDGDDDGGDDGGDGDGDGGE